MDTATTNEANARRRATSSTSAEDEIADGDAGREAREARGARGGVVAAEAAGTIRMGAAIVVKSVTTYSGGLARHLALDQARARALHLRAVAEKAVVVAAVAAAALGSTARHPTVGKERVIIGVDSLRGRSERIQPRANYKYLVSIDGLS